MLKTLFFLATIICVLSQESVLDNLNINPDTISVSGFSSGGCFATQFHTAFSASVSLSLLFFIIIVTLFC